MKSIVHLDLSWRGYDRPQGPKPLADLMRDQKIVYEALDKIGFKNLFHIDKPYYTLELEKDDQRLQEMIEAIQARPDLLSPHIRVERLFTQSELDLASLLVLRITNQSIKDDHYDLNPKRDPKGIGPAYEQCAACRARLWQRRDLVLNPNHMGKKDVSLTFTFDVILSERLATLLQENEIEGYTLRPVQNYGARGENAQRLYQLQVTNSLPPMLAPPTQFGLVRHCEVCRTTSTYLKREHYWGNIRYYEDTDIYYPKGVLEAAQDFNYTAELFGDLSVAKPMIIIGQRLYRLLRETKIKHWEAVPVQLVTGS